MPWKRGPMQLLEAGSSQDMCRSKYFFSHYFPLIGTYNVTPFSFSLWVPLIYAKKNVLRFLLWGDEISVKSTKKYFNLPKQIFSKTNHYLKKNIR